MTGNTSTAPPTKLGTVFVGGPLTQLLVPETGLMTEADRAKFSRLISYFEERGAKVYNAHRREQWGAALLTPTAATRLDYEEIRESDLFIAFPGIPGSPGTHVEIGWASGMRKPTILMLEKGHPHAFLVTGLEDHANVELIWFTEPAEIFEQLDEAVARVLARADVPTAIG